jgi:hemolysin III
VLFSTSAGYHVPRWSLPTRELVRRLDHAAIFVAIACSYTPFCLLAVPAAEGIATLVIVWPMAAAGAVLKLSGASVPRGLGVLMFIALGWVGVFMAYPLPHNLPRWAIGVLALSGVLHTIGGIVYGTRWPNPSPRIFGYHEIFHLLVVGAAGLMSVVVGVAVLPA